MTWVDRTLIRGPYVALVLSEKEYTRAFKDVGLEPEGAWMKNSHCDATVHWADHPSDGMVCIVALRNNKEATGIQVASLLLHEAVHVFQKYCEHIGEDRPSVEFEAYSIQNIAQNLMLAYQEKTQLSCKTKVDLDGLNDG